MYWNVNNLYEWMIKQNLHASGNICKFRFHEEFIQEYDEDICKGYILEVDVKYLKELHKLSSDLPFLSKRMEISRYEKLLYNLYDKKNYARQIKP